MSETDRKPNQYVSGLAGALAGMCSRTMIAPIERVKILFQISKGAKEGPSKGYLTLVPNIIKNEGALSFWKGNSAAVIRVMPYMSLQFLSYEQYKSFLGERVQHPLAANLGAGSAAGVTAVVLTYPLDVVRARMALQMEGRADTAYRGVSHALSSIARSEGARGLYRGVVATSIGAAPYTGLKFATYESLKRGLKRFLDVEEKDLPSYLRVAAGSCAGAFALTFVYPFDVVRRRLQTGTQYNSVLDAFRTIYQQEGVTRGLYRGMTLNYMKTLPNVAIYLSLYDVLKIYLSKWVD